MPVGRVLLRIDEGPPDHCAPVADGPGQHVGAIRMVAAVVVRTGLAFGVGLDQEPAEVGNFCVDLVGLGLPPRCDARVERVGGVELANLAGCREARGDVQPDTVGAPCVRQSLELGQVARRQKEWAGIDVVHDRTVDAERGIGPRIVDHPPVEMAGQPPPVENRAPRIAALDMSVRVVPVVEEAQRHRGGGSDV